MTTAIRSSKKERTDFFSVMGSGILKLYQRVVHYNILPRPMEESNAYTAITHDPSFSPIAFANAAGFLRTNGPNSSCRESKAQAISNKHRSRWFASALERCVGSRFGPVVVQGTKTPSRHRLFTSIAAMSCATSSG